jgi:hypothetical protein
MSSLLSLSFKIDTDPFTDRWRWSIDHRDGITVLFRLTTRWCNSDCPSLDDAIAEARVALELISHELDTQRAGRDTGGR